MLKVILVTSQMGSPDYIVSLNRDLSSLTGTQRGKRLPRSHRGFCYNAPMASRLTFCIAQMGCINKEIRHIAARVPLLQSKMEKRYEQDTSIWGGTSLPLRKQYCISTMSCIADAPQ